MNLHNKLGKSFQSGMVYRTFTIQPKFTADFGQNREQKDNTDGLEIFGTNSKPHLQ